jgi:hypothetical protein
MCAWIDDGTLQVEGILNRQDLAMKIYVRGDHNPESAFADADAFIEECERQRKQPEPPRCEHEWSTRVIVNGDKIVACNYCGLVRPKDEPAPNREAREWTAYIDIKGGLRDGLGIFAPESHWDKIKVREVLE